MNHWETHLYTYAVALTQGYKIKPENLAGMRAKAINHGHTEAECVFVEHNTHLYIAKGILSLEEDRVNVAVTVQSRSSETAPYQRARTHMVCAECGSTNVRADAYAEWDADSGQWVLHSSYDAKYCANCEIGTSLLEVDEAIQLEIQMFGMVNDEDGSRLAEDDESPAFFDVMVTTTPFESGVILTLEEHENMTAKGAARVLSQMVEAYPTAAMNSVNCDLGAA